MRRSTAQTVCHQRCLASCLLLLSVAGFSDGSSAHNSRTKNPSVKRPNIVFILADDLGWNDVGFHGSNTVRTPNIDALAYNGLILNSHYSENLCTPSRGALLTGRYPIHTGTQHNVIVEAAPWGLPLSETLMPQHLKRLGYVSHAVGKWHLGFYRKEYTPTYRGFASHYGFWNSHQDYFTHMVQASFSPYEGLDMRENMTVDYSSRGKYTTRLLTERAEKLIREHNYGYSGPLFLYLAYSAVHSGNYEDPLQAPRETIETFSHIRNEDKRVYAAMLWELDVGVGKVVRALKDRGVLDNTIIAFVSDNGAATRGLHKNTGSNWPLKGEKSTPWEGALRTVAVLWSSAIARKGRVVNNLMHLTDWLPTLYAAAGGSKSDLIGIDGVNQWHYFTQGGPEPRWEILQNIDDIYGYSAMRYGNYKYVNGTALLGYLDSWYGQEDKTPQSYNLTAVFDSAVSRALAVPLSEKSVLNLRKNAVIRCRKSDYNAASPRHRRCDAKKAPCLFNILYDPCETNNIYEPSRSLVLEIERRIFEYRKTMVPPGNQGVESIANPFYYNNTWVNWGDFKDLREKQR